MKLRALIGAALLACAGTAPAAPAQTDSLAMALGAFVGNVVDGTVRDFEMRGLSVDREALGTVLADILAGRPAPMSAAEADAYLNRRFSQAVMEASAPADTLAEAAFVAAAAAEPGAVTLPDGLVVRALREGSGARPGESDSVRLRYVGTFSDGDVFDAIGPDEAPAVFPVGELTPGFSEGLQHMREGGRYRLTMPASLGYGDEGVPGAIPPGAALRFEVDLLEVIPHK